MAYPSTIDAFPDPLPDDPRNAPSLAGGQVLQNSAIEAIETYVGVSGSAVPGTVTNNITNTSGWLFASGVPAGGTGSNGNLYTDTATGIIYRKTAGSWAATYTPPVAAPDLGYVPASMHNLKGWSFDPSPVPMTTSAVMTSGQLVAVRLRLPAGTITNLHALSAGGGTMTNFFMALYTAAGARLSTSSNQVATANAGGFITAPLAVPQVITAGDYYAAMWYSGGVQAAWFRINQSSALTTLGLAAPNLRYTQTNDTGLTTTAPATLGTQSVFTNVLWAGAS